MDAIDKAAQTVIDYHNRTKHTLQRYAKGPETIDWDDQPDPFRRFLGCEIITLPKPGRDLPITFAGLDQPETISRQPFNIENLGLLLELAFGLSAWKEFGPSRWSLRCNPSSGNLHPTEAYFISTGQSPIEPGVYHYLSHDHALERRCRFGFDETGSSGFWLGLSSVHWREAWKYGERAFRYCQHDIGHAVGSLNYAAGVLGWSITLEQEISDEDLAKLLGLDRTADFKKNELEFPDLLCRISIDEAAISYRQLLNQAAAGTWYGKAESLKAYHLYNWPVIDEVCAAAGKSEHDEPAELKTEMQSKPAIASTCRLEATKIIRQRRSAQQFDGKMEAMPQQDFYRIMGAVMPHTPAFSAWPYAAKINLFVFVHRVQGLEPGLYALVRNEAILADLKQTASESFDWKRQTESLPLYHLHSGDLRQIAKTLSCHQPIASDSAFSLGMVAEFRSTVLVESWRYRQLFWESGLIGQVLYLEAEAAGFRGTGIGCFFDDSVHEILGFKNQEFQSLYHFTIGKPLEDNRLQTLPAYTHLFAKDAEAE